MSSRVPDIASGLLQTDSELQALHHRLNNQLGIVLAHAELLETRALDDAHRAMAARIIAGALEAVNTARQIRRRADASAL